jgi:hypothetical protein
MTVDENMAFTVAQRKKLSTEKELEKLLWAELITEREALQKALETKEK